MTRAALYARYSTDKQSAASAEDQLRLCRLHAEQQGWSVVASFADEALSGATRARPGLTQLLARAAEFDVVIAESLDRISRDQEDIAAIHKRLRFAGVSIVTLADGAVGEIHIGLKGTMAALFLTDLAQKTRRGQIGRVAAGRIPGGISYGYRKVIALAANGEPERGLREIDEAEAAVVRRIFAESLTGRGAHAIVADLNREGITSPGGGLWRTNTLVGHRQRRNGILHNELYIGRIVYNRQRFERDPDTRRRVSRMNPRDQWKIAEVPHLRIVDQASFDAVQARFEQAAHLPAHRQRRPRQLLSGLIACGECGGNVTIVCADRWGCSVKKQSGTCGNGRTIGTKQLEERILGALERQMLAPDVVQAYVAEFHKAKREQRARMGREREQIEGKVAAAGARIQRLVRLAAEGLGDVAEGTAQIRAAEDERARLTAALADADAEQVIPLHPGIEEKYRRAIAQLAEAFAGGSPKRDEAREGIRALIDGIVMHPRQDGRGVELELHGRLAELLALTQKKGASLTGSALEYTSKLVAGARSRRCSILASARC